MSQQGSTAMATNLPAFAGWCYTQSERWSEIAQAQKVNRKRGAWRRPQITGAVSKLEKELWSTLEFTEHAIALVLARETVDNVQAEETVDTAALEEAALDHHGLDRGLRSQTIDRSALAAILLLLARFRSRQLALANETIEAVYQASRAALLKRLKRPDVSEAPGTVALLAQVKVLYESDAQRFFGDLLDPSPRSRGIREIVEKSTTLGEAVLALRNLFDIEAYRLSLFSESLVHSSWMAGFRGAAVSATASALAAGEEPMRFLWAGPQDTRACAPCLAAFGDGPILARSLSDIPLPSDRCVAGRACRHYFVVV